MDRSAGGNRLRRSAAIPAVLLLALATILCGCSPYSGVSSSKPRQIGSQLIAPIIVPHRQYTTGDAWLDISSSDYPSLFFTRTKLALADAIGGLVSPNQDGATITLGWISENSFDYTSTFMTIIIPPLPADSPQPALKPYPPPGDNLYQYAIAKKQVDANNAASLQRWQQSLQANHALLDQVRKQVKAQTDVLRRTAPVVVDTIATDIHGALARTGLRMRHVRGGEKLLVLATDMAENTYEQVTPDLALQGVQVTFLTPCVNNANACEQSMGYWQQALLAAGARSVVFLDPTETQVRHNLFSPE